jgi:toxin-antitoxin system PIN domain toxin
VTTYLLDANVLVALTVEEHEHHERARLWASGLSSFALCPVVQGAMMRFFLRMGESYATAVAVLRGVHERPGCTFWPDDLSYHDADLPGVRGHRQLTDAYLVALARSRRDAILVTLDQGLHEMAPGGSFLLPALS